MIRSNPTPVRRELGFALRDRALPRARWEVGSEHPLDLEALARPSRRASGRVFIELASGAFTWPGSPAVVGPVIDSIQEAWGGRLSLLTQGRLRSVEKPL